MSLKVTNPLKFILKNQMANASNICSGHSMEPANILLNSDPALNGPKREKTCLLGFAFTQSDQRLCFSLFRRFGM